MTLRPLLAAALALAVLAPAPAIHASDAEAPAPGARVAGALRELAPTAGVTALPAITPVPCGSLADAVAAFAAYMRVDVPTAPLAIDGAEADAIARLVCTLHAAALARDAAYEGADWLAIVQAALNDSPDSIAALPVDLVPPGALAANLAGAIAIAEAVDDALDVLKPRAVPQLAGAAEVPRSPPAIDLEPVLAVDNVGVDTEYRLDYALTIDVGGNDLYRNNAGGSLIAIGDGPFFTIMGDRSTWQHPIVPLGPGGPKVVVGGAFEDAELIVSATLALDLAGDDTYGVRGPPITDARCTSDPLVTRVVIQGTGAGGPGMLFDLGGANDLNAKSIAQGAGHVGGVGVLYLGEGPDDLEAVRLAQGSGLFFGVGLVINEGGDDRYLGRSPAGGLFNTDQGFCDDVPRYFHGSGFGRVTGGALGFAGALYDHAGNDRYEVQKKSLGFGETGSIGLFYDAEGDDEYVTASESLGFGAAHPDTSGAGIGLFLDAAGNDRYVLADSKGLGEAAGRVPDPNAVPLPSLPPTFWLNEVLRAVANPLIVSGAGVFVDAAGADEYPAATGRENGATTTQHVVGVFVDAE